MRLKTGDTVLIISGKYKGKKGKITKVLSKEKKIIVDGVNFRKKHIRPKQEGGKGQVVEIAAPFDASNAKLICPRCKMPTRVGYRIVKKRKIRICKKCGQEI